MPYDSSSDFVGSFLSTLSFARTNLDNFVIPFIPKLVLPQTADLHGKLAVVTGANSGIGLEVARGLASMGAQVVLACRNDVKGQAARLDIIESTGNKNVEVLALNLSSFSSVKEFLSRWEARKAKQVDILINNAGCMLGAVSVTEDGFEQMYQANHLGHVLLTISLLNLGYMAPHARIVNVASCASYGSDEISQYNTGGTDVLANYPAATKSMLTFGDVMLLYARSKAAQAMWTIALQRRLSQIEGWKNISVHVCHPGTVKSSFWGQPDGVGSMTGRLSDVFRLFGSTFGIANEEGSVTPIWLATAPEPATPELRGLYWDRMRWKWVRPWILDVARQDELWNKWCQDIGVSLR